MTYEEALRYIAELAPRGWRLGLDRMQEFAIRAGLEGALGEPSGPQFLHVAGTNGKGTVTAMLQSMLVESGHRTGAFFSPFVYDPRERVQLGRSLISREALADLTTRLAPVAEGMVDTPFEGPTEFEFKTALGFKAWQEAACEWVALEVGLGGRLDATNIITSRCAGIVSIGMDHMAILGDTEAKIATEKAGIIKPGVPLVLGEVSEEARAAILGIAAEREAPVWQVGQEVRYEGTLERLRVTTPKATYTDLQCPDLGEMAPHNLAVAIAMMDAGGATVSPEAIARGAERTAVPGRLERREARGRRWLLDGAHNPPSARLLRRALARIAPGGVTLVTGMVRGHEPADFYRELFGCGETAHVVPIDFHRAQPPEDLAPVLREGFARVVAHPTLSEGLDAAVETTPADGLILVTGSFYLVGEVGRSL